MKVMLIIGVRPQIIKSAPVIRLLDKDKNVTLQLVNSGQHYDFGMSKAFFEDLRLPEPSCNLEVGSGSHATQTGMLMMQVEKVLGELKPNVVVVFGDANTTLGATLAAVKLHVPICHVEAGCRSYDMTIPEEVNRVLTDYCSKLLCAPTLTAFGNLRCEGVDENRIVLTGDTMYDILLQHRKDIQHSHILNDLGLKKEAYAVLTCHRPKNVDNLEVLTNIILATLELAETKIVFPIHPRTRKMLENARLKLPKHVVSTQPLNYFDMLALMENSTLTLTDSGGIQKEAFLLKVPCVTLRSSTEWPETVRLGANKLVGSDPKRIIAETRRILHSQDAKSRLERLPNPYGDGKASEKIVECLKERF
jgi:UDP-N-acetylglucosamine 2-epimerase (non-hydrolysing)